MWNDWFEAEGDIAVGPGVGSIRLVIDGEALALFGAWVVGPRGEDKAGFPNGFTGTIVSRIGS